MSTLRVALRILIKAAVVGILMLLPSATRLPTWHTYTFQEGFFVDSPASQALLPSSAPSAVLPPTPDDWSITARAFADAINDGNAEWVLVIWRPWRDWPIQRWTDVLSPITDFHDATGHSCHLVLLDPQDGREIWAGSALPAPLLALTVGDVDGDGNNEVVTLEGDYAAGRDGPATYVDVWRWNGFGFTLEWRSLPGTFYQLLLTDVDNDAILDIAVR